MDYYVANCIISIFALTLILVFIYWYLTKTFDHWAKQNVPCMPNPIPGYGHMWPVVSFQEKFKDFTLKAYESTDASMIGFYYLRKPAIILRDAELVKSVLETNFSSFRGNFLESGEYTDPTAIKQPSEATDHHEWKASRTRANRHLSTAKLQHLFVIVERVSSKFSDYIARKVKENADCYECEQYELFSRYTGEIVANAAFATDGQGFRDKPDKLSFAKIAYIIFVPTFKSRLSSVLSSFFPRLCSFVNLFVDLNSIPQWVNNYFTDCIKAAIKQRKQDGQIPPSDYLQFCIEANGIDAVHTISEDAIQFFSDVTNLPTTTLVISFYYLSLNQRLQNKARKHVVSVLEETKGEITYDSLEKMEYLEQVILESMRFNPPIELLQKICTEEIQLEAPDGLTCALKPNDPVFIQVFGLNGEEKYWPNPEYFDPDRFSPENQATRDRYTFLGFGEGPRQCIGIRLAMLIMKLALISLLTKFKLEPSTKQELGKGVWAKFKKLDFINRYH